MKATLDTYAVAAGGRFGDRNRERRRTRTEFPSHRRGNRDPISGTAELTGQQVLDLVLDAKADASVAAAFTEALRVRGATEVHAAVTGPLAQPQAKGYIQMTDGQLRCKTPESAWTD